VTRRSACGNPSSETHISKCKGAPRCDPVAPDPGVPGYFQIDSGMRNMGREIRAVIGRCPGS
jgi:hypothetical protein